MKKLMILGASVWQLPAIHKAKDMGLDVIVVDMNPSAVGFKVPGVKIEVISTIDIDKVVECAKKHRIDGIITVASDMPVRSIAAVSEELGVIGITKDTAYKATNKAAMRRCLKEKGVPIPEFYSVDTFDDYYAAIKNFSGKFIVKPADNAGSRGVTLIEDKSDAKRIEQSFSYSKEASRCGTVMVEEYMEGPELSVEILSYQGVCHVIQITDKLTTGSPHFVEMGHNEPSILPQLTKNTIEKVAKNAVEAVGIKNGPSHTEVIVTKSGPKIVELGARLGGDFITTNLVPLSTGVDMVECLIHIALGEKPDMSQKWNKGSAIRYMKTGIGRISSFTGVEEAKKISGVKEVGIIHGVGDWAVEVKNSVERVGFVIAQMDTPQEAIKVCEKALAAITVTVEQ